MILDTEQNISITFYFIFATQEIERVSQNPGVSSELENLRTRKMELEMRLSELQQTRKDLMIELEQLMKVLKVQGPSNNQASKFSTKISRNQTARQEF